MIMLKNFKVQIIVTIITNIIMYIFLAVLVNDYTDAFAISIQVILMLYFTYIVLCNIGRYISKYIISAFLLCVIVQYILFYCDIPRISSGFMGLGGGSFGLLMYEIELIMCIVLMCAINIVKKIVLLLSHK